ncbi:MAG: hypothetical protein JST67_03885 [Bacteroidetes bacterium]|nr:hypothetical protein [Bacteroidota bacterium]
MKHCPRVLSERSYLSTCQVIPEFKAFEKNSYNQNFYIKGMLGDILGLAAHEEMYKLLEKYDYEDE